MHWLPRIAVGAAVALLVAAGYVYFTERPPPTRLVVPTTEFDLGRLTPGEHVFHVTIRNPTGEERRVVGISYG